jgi:hypothetical protein
VKRVKRMNFEKRVRVSPPATPEEALKTLAIADEQRDTLIPGLLKIREEVRGYDCLARRSPNLKERMRDLHLARTALVNLTKALATPFRNDLIEAMDDEVISPGLERRSVLFLKLLPVVKRYIDAMTADDIRERWNEGSDRRSVNLECLDYETGAVFDLAQKAGFGLDEPNGQTVELIRRMFSYTSGKTVGISMARKRLAAWKTPGKQNTCALHGS